MMMKLTVLVFPQVILSNTSHTLMIESSSVPCHTSCSLEMCIIIHHTCTVSGTSINPIMRKVKVMDFPKGIARNPLKVCKFPCISFTSICLLSIKAPVINIRSSACSTESSKICLRRVASHGDPQFLFCAPRSGTVRDFGFVLLSLPQYLVLAGLGIFVLIHRE